MISWRRINPRKRPAEYEPLDCPPEASQQQLRLEMQLREIAQQIDLESLQY